MSALPPMETPDPETIAAALRGDAVAFEMVIRAHSRALFAVAYAILQDAAEAEDVVQETFLRAWRARWRLRDPAKLPAWLGTMARNRACDFLRRRRIVPLEAEAPEAAGETSAEPDAQMMGADLRRRVQTALADLPETHRIAVTLRYLDGLDHRAIEQTMGLSNGALRGILGRALAALRKTLSHETPDGTALESL